MTPLQFLATEVVVVVAVVGELACDVAEEVTEETVVIS